jgi:serine/threonine protein kinase
MLRDWRNGDQQALERDSHERDAFLAQAGEGDDTLHSEVTQLLDGHANANSFIETPAHEVAADIFAAQLVGQQLNHYKILALLGQKGMGEVCQAPDTKLDRVVALKILPADLALNAERMRRIVREAKAASALNHPHVATIHEIGEASTEMGTLPNKLTRHFIGQALC